MCFRQWRVFEQWRDFEQMWNEGSPPEPALRPEINLLFVLPVHRPEIERLPGAVKVKNASFRRRRSRFDPGEVHNKYDMFVLSGARLRAERLPVNTYDLLGASPSKVSEAKRVRLFLPACQPLVRRRCCSQDEAVTASRNDSNSLWPHRTARKSGSDDIATHTQKHTQNNEKSATRLETRLWFSFRMILFTSA